MEQDCHQTCFTNPLSEDLEGVTDQGLHLQVTGSNPAQTPEGTAEEDTVPLVIDPDLELKVRRACERISENVHICANEPSLGTIRILREQSFGQSWPFSATINCNVRVLLTKHYYHE